LEQQRVPSQLKRSTWVSKGCHDPTFWRDEVSQACCVYGGSIYIVGGLDQSGSRLSSLVALDAATQTWRMLPSMAIPRSLHAALIYHGTIYVIGGATDEGGAVSSTETFNIDEGVWDMFTPLPVVRAEMAVVAYPCPCIAGGSDLDGLNFPQVYRIEPGTPSCKKKK